ncbi:MAG: hypothetical protein CVU38_08180 [Chloroflexi bacterium HGW-Chloroflexi-1]|nr:MAG: hypothetical protein CVU38_08180 [Chloroflexi bacterium HGW-Chloroflexi-1]
MATSIAARRSTSLDLTCDFCVLYIEHRREVANLIQASEPPAQRSAAVRRKYPKGGPSVIMEKLQLNIPDMYADHHVLKVRSALTAVAGVQEVIASSAFRLISVTHDPATVTPEAIEATLAEAGYPVGDNGAGVMPNVVPVKTGSKDPAWNRLGVRISKTDMRDAKLSR